MKLNKMQLARLIAWIAPKMKFAVTEENIRDLDDLISVDVPQPDVAYPSVSDINMLMYMMSAGTQKIEAIKVHRKLTGWGLKESKDQVEKYWVSKLDEPKPYFPPVAPAAPFTPPLANDYRA